MAKRRAVTLQFPAAGLNKRYAYQSQPPYTSPRLLNVRASDIYEDRARGGQRPGLCKEYYDELGSGSPVDLLDTVTTVATSTGHRFTFSDEFDRDTLGDGWAAASWVGTAPTVKRDLESSLTYSSTVGAVHDAVDLDTSSAYQIMMRILPYQGAHHGSYFVYLRMDDTTPVATTDGIVIELDLDGTTGTYDGSIKVYSSGSLTNTYVFTTTGNTTTALPGWFRVHVDGDTITCYYMGVQVITQAVSAAAGDRFGFGMAADAGGVCLVDVFIVEGASSDPTPDQAYRQYLCAASNGSMYSDQTYGTLTAATGAGLADGYPLQSVERGQKLYIADYEVEASYGTDGTVSGTSFDATAETDWTAIGINTTDYVVEIWDATGPTAGVYGITTIEAGNLTLSSAPGDGTCTYRVVRAPKVFDPTANAVSILSADSGNVPQNCSITALFRDRLVLAGDDRFPNLWYMSAFGDPEDWDYSDGTATGAVSGNTSDQAGIVGFPIKALCAYRDDYLVFGGVNGLAVLNGDPAAGGYIRILSNTIGIASPHAWCFGTSGDLYFLDATDGLYMLPPGGNDLPRPMSRDKLPRELSNIDTKIVRPVLAYDVDRRGINIWVYPIGGGSRKHWFVSMDTGGFFEDSYSDDHIPRAWARYGEQMLLGCGDGYIRRYDDACETDDGTNINSYVEIGPLRLAGSDMMRGRLTQMRAVLSSNSGPVSWAIRQGDSSEEATIQ